MINNELRNEIVGAIKSKFNCCNKEMIDYLVVHLVFECESGYKELGFDLPYFFYTPKMFYEQHLECALLTNKSAIIKWKKSEISSLLEFYNLKGVSIEELSEIAYSFYDEYILSTGRTLDDIEEENI